MVWVRIREKFHGAVNKTPIWQHYKTAKQARVEIGGWNRLTPRDHLTVLATRQVKPVGLVKKHPNVYHETSRYVHPKKRVVHHSRQKDIFGGAFKNLGRF